MNAPLHLNQAILRPDDLLVLSVETVNLRLDTSAPDRPRLVRGAPSEAAYLIYVFPPQSIAEEAFFEKAKITKQPSFNTPPGPPEPPTAADPLKAPGSVSALVAGESRLVFRLPPALTEVEFSIEGLLDWSQLELVLPAAAQVLPAASSAPSGPPPIAAPGSLETSLELPYKLMMSPNVMPGGALPGWQHAAAPVLHAGRAELWHTRLGQLAEVNGQIEFTEASTASPVPLRAVWSPDFVANGPLPAQDTTFRTAMTSSDRDQIVILTSGFTGYTLTERVGHPEPYVPVPVNASRVFLSALGGWLTSRGAWPYPVSYRLGDAAGHLSNSGLAAEPGSAAPRPDVVPLDLIEWDHLATQGRDHHVKIVYEGYLHPPGHRATLVKVSERKVLAPNGDAGNPADSPVAYLRQRMYIVPREHDKSYLGEPYNHQGREMPFASLVRINTKVTPDLDPPKDNATWFWVNVGGNPFQFHMTARDLAGQEFDFLAPLIFVSLSATDLDAVTADYVSDSARRRCAVGGQKVAYADPAAGDTALKTRALYFTAQRTGEQAPYPVAPFIPVLDSAEVTIPSLAEILGQQTAALISLYRPYLASGLDPNAGVFATIEGTQPGVSFSADRSGGFAQPNIVLTALSARKGLVSGAASDAAQGNINPGVYFGPPDALLFGTVPLGDLIPVDANNLASAADNAPTIRTEAKPDATHPKELVTVLTWQPQLKPEFDARTLKTPLPVKVLFNTGGASALKLQVTIQNDLSGQPPTSETTGELTNFTLQLFGVVSIAIASIKFTSTNGAKTLVALDLADNNPISFDGPLQFVQTLANILPPGMFGGEGPSIQATNTELEVSYTLGLPPVTCGVFSLDHVAIMAGLDLPYLDGKPVLEFAFSSRSKPFLLTVELFGGGGSIHLIVGASGVQLVEGSLEFGGNFALDIGVASGGVHAMAGIYFQLKGTDSDLTGFVDVGGEVSVLGVVSVSLDLNLSLSWQHSDQGNVIEGRATMTVSVHVLFFSASVELSVERSFSAGGADPDVGQLMTADQWSQYAGAFA